MLKLARCPLSLAATLGSFTFYVAHPIRSIRELAGMASKSASQVMFEVENRGLHSIFSR
jgi:hypothetical protein